MKTSSDKKCHSRFAKVLDKMEALYNRAFPSNPPTEAFWPACESLANEWGTLTAKRPIGEADLDKAEKAWLKKFIDLCVVERARVQQT